VTDHAVQLILIAARGNRGYAEHKRGGSAHHAPCAEAVKFRLQMAAKKHEACCFLDDGRR